VFPLISLEGRKFWILGLTPMSRDQLLWGKFVFAATGSLVIAEGLILVSDAVLGLPWDGMLLHALVMAVVAVGLSGLNVGLGAYLPTFKETDPSKIVVGFGGTVNMVTGLGFLVAVIAVMAVPFHTAQLSRGMSGGGGLNPWVFVGIPVGVFFGVLAVVIPLRVGARSLRKMEF
jgi:ABC-2 type transport system permease protein